MVYKRVDYACSMYADVDVALVRRRVEGRAAGSRAAVAVALGSNLVSRS